ncbi:MAG: hypothetical protein CBC03_04845 [Pseudoalteromonas sp. TMED43]|mgnify:CR=1 FL=1|nr:MAG: hypothetical protein CBC03_04845 [Pseudoalteromonas sp. TMED43]|tara:strand:- start:767 stop:1540 length:774 start_codon:yes stop_codon:yes gene_type:complete
MFNIFKRQEVSPVTEVKVEKYGSQYINYEVTERPGKPLVFVFSGVDTVPGRCRTSYYGFHNTLDANVVHIADNFGAFGCYFLAISRDESINQAFCALVHKIREELGVPLESTYFVGTSKGATTAIIASLSEGGGTVIAGEPQIKLGDFVYHDNWQSSLSSSALSQVIAGRIDDGEREYLNELVEKAIKRNASDYRGNIEILYGEKTGYHWRHLRHLEPYFATTSFDMKRLVLVDCGIETHNDIIGVFQQKIRQTKFS